LGEYFTFHFRVFYQEVDEAFLTLIKQDPLLEILADLELGLDQDFSNREEGKLLEDLAVEYCRLFLGPGPHLSPYESTNMSGEDRYLMGPAALDVVTHYRRYGLQVQREFGLCPDHISFELNFISFLARKEMEAHIRGKKTEANIYRIEQGHFFEEHLLGWVPRFCQEVMAEARESFYRAMGRLTLKVLDFDFRHFLGNNAGRGGEEAGISERDCQVLR